MAKKKSLILGCSGQDGALLSLSLLKQDYEVIGTSRKLKTNKSKDIANHSILGIEKDIKLVNCDITNFDEVSNLIEKYKPIEIYNLAAQSSVGESFDYPQETLKSIVEVTINLLEVSRTIEYNGNLFFAGSSEVFGNTESRANINKKQKPANPYGIAKQTSFNLVKLYRNLHNLKCVTGILFNHESPLRSKKFVTQKIISEALLCSKNKSHKLRIGNINIKRDWGWAEEFVEGFQVMNRTKDLKDQIICTGKSTKLEKFIKIVFKKLNLDWRDHIVVDSDLFRKGEIKQIYGDPTQMKIDLDWKAKVELETIIEKLIEFKLNPKSRVQL